jgi:hypothetical protein
MRTNHCSSQCSIGSPALALSANASLLTLLKECTNVHKKTLSKSSGRR